MNLVIVTAAVAATLLGLAILAMRDHRAWLAISAIVLMSVQAFFVLTFAMGGLRAHVTQARSKGVSDDFVGGMIERDWFFVAPRVALGICILGLLVVCIAAVKGHVGANDRGAG